MTTDPHRRVLVIDDEASVRRMLGAALRQRSLVVDEAVDGSNAIALLSENRYAVVLLDLLMPNVDGFGVLDALADGAHPPIVLVVSGADRRVIDQLDSRKIHGIVRKPFDPVEIADVVAACTEIRGRSALGTMAYATALAGAPLIALLKL
ncbi:MAG TPA: response regulator [Thermoanaerobaculia bacterium]|nr:response regulator [Thermoanaerobaculia bacterium]